MVKTDEEPKKIAFKERALEKLRERRIAVFGIVLGAAVTVPDAWKQELTFSGALGLFFIVLFLYLDTALSMKSGQDRAQEELHRIRQSINSNTNALRAHEYVLASRIPDNLTLIGFKNLLAYLPFYLAEDLGYLEDEHIKVALTQATLDDQTTANELQGHRANSIAICDPYMCATHSDLRVVYPLCHGIAAWPMTLNWIGSVTATRRKILIAAYKAPSTTHVLAHVVEKKVIRPLIRGASDIGSIVVELTDEEARFGEDEDRESTSNRIRNLLIKYDVVMLWEPHCEIALSLGARYLRRDAYEGALKEFQFPVMYTGLLISEELAQTNPTLPIRLRRALDRATARLRDPNRLLYCNTTLRNRGLLSGFASDVQEAVLERLVESIPEPVDPGLRGWNVISQHWADGLFAADRLRQYVVQNDPGLAARLGVRQRYTNAGECRSLIYSAKAAEGA